MAYTPDATDGTQPIDNQKAGTMGLEFRTLKSYIQSFIKPYPVSAVVAGAFTITDWNKVILATGNLTVPDVVFAQGKNVWVYNNSGASITLTGAGGMVLRLEGTATTGPRTLTQRGWAQLFFVGASECVVIGPHVT